MSSPNINDSPSLWLVSKMMKLMLEIGQKDLLVEWNNASTDLVVHKILQFLLDHGQESLVTKWLDEAERMQKSIERHRQLPGQLLDFHLPAEASRAIMAEGRKNGHVIDPEKEKG